MRQQVAQRYEQLLNDAGISTTPYVEPHNTSVYAQYTVRVENRESVRSQLKEAGIPTAVHYPIPLNKQPAVADTTVKLFVGDGVAEQVISLPMHPYLTSAQLVEIVDGFGGKG
ncbi:UDP-2-acetamido-2-deoxy-3-oxo-D-glucuronate aminotransferase [compost metagenome]